MKSIADVPEEAIPFVFDGHLYLQSTLNDTIPVTLIYDTGADFLYLDEDSVMKKKSTLVSKRLVGVTAPESSVMSSTVSKSSETDAQKIARLERELLESRMLSDIYNEIINVAEEKFNIQIRKKAGTKQ